MICRVRAIIKRDNTLLLVRHKDPTNSHTYGSWVLPGGHVEDGEMLVDAVRRELQEELGVDARVGNLLYVHQFMSAGAYSGPEFFFGVEDSPLFDSINLSNTSHGLSEIAEIGFYDPRTLDGVLPPFLTEVVADIDMKAATRLITTEIGV